jgi:menaquinone-9 beta-reductase
MPTRGGISGRQTKSAAKSFKNLKSVTEKIDVLVIGGGLAGMAAGAHLADAGLRVVCIEAEPQDNNPVGESLDWSAPDLLKSLGLPMELLLNQGIATYKRHVILKLKDGSHQDYTPGEWLGKPPYNVNLDTLHVDRAQLNPAIREIARAKGVTFVNDRVQRVETTGKIVNAVVTVKGERHQAHWFLDASGRGASLFPRVFRLPVYENGPHKVTIWDYFKVTESIEGTTLYADAGKTAYMDWIWQIPIHPDMVSVGFVCAAELVKEKRQQGVGIRQIFAEQLERFPDLRAFSGQAANSEPRTVSFRCRAFAGTAGPNWLVAGEAAAMVDPMTANGVTAALRQAAEASRLIIRFRDRGAIPHLAAAMYSQRLLSLARFFNIAIENVLYDWPVRKQIGPFPAGDLYTIPAWSINAIYSRFRPDGLVSTTLFRMLLASVRCSLGAFSWVCRLRAEPISISA